MARGAKPTDPQIATSPIPPRAIDISAAKQALQKSKNKEVKEFAQDMVRDHEAVNKQALELVKKLKVTPEDNDTTRTLSKQASEKLTELSKLNGAAFDKAYVESEVAYHMLARDALKKSIGQAAAAPRKAAAGQKEMLLPISNKRAAKEEGKKVEKGHPLALGNPRK
jgi:putative membrane protein